MTELSNVPLEGKAAATHRLQREGRWGEATAFKDKVADDLKAAGMKRSEANSEAWAQMIAAFPPLEEKDRTGTSPSDANTAPLLPPDQFTAMADSTVDTFEEDAFWVLNNLESPNVDFAAAPTKGCLALYRWAQQEPKRFLDRIVVVVAKAIKESKPPSKQKTSQEQIERNRARTDELKRRLGMM